MENNSISVSQLCGYIKGIFDAEELLHGISVFGEVCGFSLIRGNAYFTLKDDLASLSCVFFGYNTTPLQEGAKVVVTGSPNFYVKGGKLNFNAYKVEPLGMGELYIKFLMLKQQLEKEGLFDNSHKRPLPRTINKIGVVTSKEGAVLQDIINVTTRRNPFINILVYPARVQGIDAYKTIIKGIKYLNTTDVDLIVVARGGGSIEDLSNFNNEELARTVFDSEKVIISAVGHETDFTIIDFVADIRASTPSVAGEFVTKDVVGLVDIFEKNSKTLLLKYNLFLNQKNYMLDSNITKLNSIYKKLLDFEYISLSHKKEKIDYLIKNFIEERQNKIVVYKNILQKLNPLSILQMGYAKVEQNQKCVTSAFDLTDDNLDIVFKDGKVTVKKV